MTQKPERVKVVNSKGAVAHPLKADLAKWQKAGWSLPEEQPGATAPQKKDAK